MPSGLRVFISHSAKKAEAVQFRDRVVAQLGDDGHMVLVDKDGIELGADWRSTINAWIGGCDVAVVLLSEDALKSRYMLYECAILAYRKEDDRPFELLPLIRPPVTPEAVEASQLGTTMIQRWQFTRPEDRDADVIRKLREKLATLKPAATPLDKCARKVRHLLEQSRISDEDMEKHLEHLADQGAEVRPWVPGEDLASKLAVTMLAAGLAASVDFIRDIREYLDSDGLRNLIDLLACSWVDYRSIRRIPQAALDERLLGVNAEDPVIARMYVIRAAIEQSNLSPRNSWPFTEIHAITAPADDAADLDVSPDEWRAQQLRQQIVSSLSAGLSGANPQEVDDWLKAQQSQGEPVFVALPAYALTSNVLLNLCRSLTGVALFLLTGSEPLTPDLERIATVIRPQLEAGSEERFLLTYKVKREFLTRRFTWPE